MSRSICFVDSVEPARPTTLAAEAQAAIQLAQPYLLGQAFRLLGRDVSIITRHDSVPAGCSTDGLRVIEGGSSRSRRWPAGMDSSALQRALEVADADLYFEFCELDGARLVSRFCRRERRRHLVRLCVGAEEGMPRRRAAGRWLAQSLSHRAVRHADLVSVSSVDTEQALCAAFDVSAAVVNSAVPPALSEPSAVRDVGVLRIGSVDSPACGELVPALERVDCVDRFVVLDPARPAATDMLTAADDSATMAGRDATGDLALTGWLSRSKLLLCDRDSLDTPETLQLAWSHGVPVVAVADPDGVIEQNELGVVLQSRRDLGRAVSELLADAPRLTELATRCRRFAAEHYSADAVAARYAALFGFSAAKYGQPV